VTGVPARIGFEPSVLRDALNATGAECVVDQIARSGPEWLFVALRSDDELGDALAADDTVRDTHRLGDDQYQVVVRAVDALHDGWVDRAAVLQGATARPDGWVLDLRFPDREGLQAYFHDCLADGLSPELRSVGECCDGGGTRWYDPLTEGQRELLAAAHKRGYFEVPRGASLGDIADDFDTSEQTVSETIRRALDTLVGQQFADAEPSTPTRRGGEAAVELAEWLGAY
jgi:hypothetical protein